MTLPRTRWLPPLLLALAWGVLPALPALWRGELLGQPFTDLYPSVWGLWWFAGHQPGLPVHTSLLGFPDGMGLYFSSPLKGWLAWPLLPLIGLPATFNLLVLLARVATVMAAWGAARAWGLAGAGALAAAAVYGCAPFFQGYAVEGIIEGTDGWALALLAWALGRNRRGLAAGALLLTVLSSWYMAMVGVLVVVLAIIQDRRRWPALLGLVAAAPFIAAFIHSFPAGSPLPDEIRAAMGAPLRIPRPGLTEGLNPFAITAYVGWITAAAALSSRSAWLALAVIPAALSLGIGPLYHLPVLESVRFPYRWHAGTLLFLAMAVGRTADRRRWWWLGPLIAVEGLLLSPVEPIIPGSPTDIPAIYGEVDAPLVELPGPVALPPGQLNPSRPRARYLLYAQTLHRQPSPWVPDFNGVGVQADDDWLDGLAAYDRLVDGVPRVDPALLSAHGLRLVMVHRSPLGSAHAHGLLADLRAAGAIQVADDGERALFRLPGDTSEN